MCDSIFLDYHWSLDRLHRSRSFAGDRAVDVYVGVDVFGRDRFYGGGGFNCDVVNHKEIYISNNPIMSVSCRL